MNFKIALDIKLFFYCLLFLFASCESESSTKDTYARGEMPLQHGMQLFNQHCASCHTFTENSIGPSLAGVTSEVDKEWLIQFIHNPAQIIESGDKRAKTLFEKYKQYMPPFPMIEGEDLEDLLAFIHKFSEGEKRNKNNRPGGLINPIPAKMEESDLVLILEEYPKAPRSSEHPPFTRINKMYPISNERTFMHDLRGGFYELKEDKSLSTYMDLSKILADFVDNPGKGTGFGSWAFHPEFANNGLFYTTHNEAPATAAADFPLPDSVPVKIQGVVLEWKADNPNSDTFEGTHRELLRVDLFGSAHGLQELTFNPLSQKGEEEYGKLYLGIGDASLALGGYPFLCNSAENIWGSVIRIDPSGNNSKNGEYGIPEDNPFFNDPHAVQEIWAYGLRNPHRISWDRTGSDMMLITNIGQHSVEEVNLGKAAAHYGWPFREGSFLFDVDANPELVYPLLEEQDEYVYPVIQYDHDEGSAVSGGFVYWGDKVPELKGKYIFGDISLGMLFYSNVSDISDGQFAPVYRLNVAINGEQSDMSSISGLKRVDLRIGLDHEGELYLMTKGNGGVYKIVHTKKEAPL